MVEVLFSLRERNSELKRAEAPERRIDEWYDRYAAAIYEKCHRMLASRAEAEDAVQETFVRAYTLLLEDRGTRGGSILAWLYRIATYVCLHLLRSRRQRGEQPMEKTEHRMVVLEDGQDQKMILRETLENLLLGLDETGQALLVAHYIDGIPQGEIAKSLGISRRAVVKRLTVMRGKMSQIIGSES